MLVEIQGFCRGSLDSDPEPRTSSSQTLSGHACLPYRKVNIVAYYDTVIEAFPAVFSLT